MVVISEPHKELVGGGENAKYILECKELFMGNRGIEKLSGFEPFVNLESLWLNSNKLKKINNLDKNFRIRALYAQDNQICTLRGSLLNFTFLETLDLSNNQLRDLDKQIKVLEKMNFVKNLNLSGNPLVEEPDYRLTLIHRMPQLHVLDQHVVTDAERRRAAALIGGDVAALTVAFGRRAPPYDPVWDARVPERSQLEQELIKEAHQIREAKAAKAYESEVALFKHNPFPDIPRGTKLPPNAGMRRAQQAQDGAGGNTRQRGGLAKGGGFRPPPLAFREDPTSTEGLGGGGMGGGVGFAEPPGLRQSVARKQQQEVNSPLVAKDVFRISSCTPGHCDLEESGVRLMHMYGSGPVRFEQDRYEDFVRLRSCGREKWGLEYKEMQI